MVTNEESERFTKLVNWGIEKNIVVRFSTFQSYYQNEKKGQKYKIMFEVNFLEVSNHTNAVHRSSVGKAETFSDALDKVWKDYKRKGKVSGSK